MGHEEYDVLQVIPERKVDKWKRIDRKTKPELRNIKEWSSKERGFTLKTITS